MAYFLAYSVPALPGISSVSGHVTDIFSAPSKGTSTSVCFGSYVSMADTLTLLIKASKPVARDPHVVRRCKWVPSSVGKFGTSRRQAQRNEHDRVLFIIVLHCDHLQYFYASVWVTERMIVRASSAIQAAEQIPNIQFWESRLNPE